MSKKSTPADEQAFRCIEKMLSRSHPKQDTAAIMRTLRECFPSADAIFSSGTYLLEKAGLHPHDALLISSIPSIVRFADRTGYDKKYRLDRIDPAGKYLVSNFQGYEVEYFYVLHLDSRGRLIESTQLQEGMEDCSLFNLKKLLSEVVRLSPKAVIISHNHPGGTLRPSQEDIDCTMDAIRALTAIGVPLLDHIIVADSQAVSLRENGFVPAAFWLSQNPNNRMLRNYLLPLDENPPVPKHSRKK